MMHKKGLLGLGFLILISGLIFFAYRFREPADGIKVYRDTRDRHALLKIFKENMYWLEEVPSDESVVQFIKRLDFEAHPDRAKTNYDPQWYVYRLKGGTAGFVMFYLMSPVLGKILFVAVDELYRGKGIAQKLVSHALDILRQQGARAVELVTRVNNFAAQHVYTKLGFIEYWRQDPLVGFVRSL